MYTFFFVEYLSMIISNFYCQQCRPERCPFEDESYPASGKNSSEAMGAKEKKISSTRGCRVVSTCMQTDVIDQYKKALAKNK